MKIKLTNQLSKIHFMQYGELKMLEYNGSIEQAKNYLKRNLGITKIEYSQKYKREGFLPIGYASIETMS